MRRLAFYPSSRQSSSPQPLRAPVDPPRRQAKGLGLAAPLAALLALAPMGLGNVAQAHPLYLGGANTSTSTIESSGIEGGSADLAVVRMQAGWQITIGGASEALDLPMDAVPLHLSRLDGASLGHADADLLLISILPAEGEDRGERFDLRAGSRIGTEDSRWQALPTPTTNFGNRSLLVTPRPLIGTEGTLEQLVWIEGDDLRATAVRAARWTGRGWSQPETLSAIGPGTQTALAATTLADGNFLLAWAAYDGVDDEIRWSRFDGQEWSRPATLSANTVPDVTPTLHALPGKDGSNGALIAWSAFDGRDYRLRLARFTGRDWTEPEWHGGRGSVSPYFARDVEHGTDDGAALVFLQTVPSAWVVSQVSPAAEVVRSAATEKHVASAERAARRPMVVRLGAEGAAVRWPGIRSTDPKSSADSATEDILPWP